MAAKYLVIGALALLLVWALMHPRVDAAPAPLDSHPGGDGGGGIAAGGCHEITGGNGVSRWECPGGSAALAPVTGELGTPVTTGSPIVDATPPVSSPPAVPPPTPTPKSTEGTGALGPVIPAAQTPLSLLVSSVRQPAVVPVIHVLSGAYGSFSTSQPNALSPGAISRAQVIGSTAVTYRRGSWGPYGP